MTPIIYGLSFIGGIYVFFRLILPLLEAINYGVFITLMLILEEGKGCLNPKVWFWILISPIFHAGSRLFGESRYTSGIDLQKWCYNPPFRLFRTNKK